MSKRSKLIPSEESLPEELHRECGVLGSTVPSSTAAYAMGPIEGCQGRVSSLPTLDDYDMEDKKTEEPSEESELDFDR